MIVRMPTFLNEEQKRAVETLNGPVLVIAGAGSGKTRVITHRIINLIKKGVNPCSILAITFTNKAAKEMKERVEKLISEDEELNRPISITERPFISTFHSLGVHIIREHSAILGLNKHFSIYDRSDSKKAVKQAMETVNIDPKKFNPGIILNNISRAKGDGLTFLEYKDFAKDYMQETVANVWEKYDEILAKDKALDFDDLILKSSMLLEKYEHVRKYYSALWKYVHIDEYQDTNRVQYKIAKYLTEEHRNICAVGDADQNIYSWRGATIENIMNFERDYGESTVITLEKNYRSTKNILSAANSVIEKNTLRKKKKLYTDNDSGDKISMIVSYSEGDEARAIADEARKIISEGGNAQEIAVLYRTNFQSRALEESFIKKNIPYQLVGTRFFDRKEVKDVLSYIRASLNRDSWADISRIINTPQRGIGKVSVIKIMSGRMDLLPSNTRAKVDNFWKLLDDIKLEIMKSKPSEAVRFAIQESGLESSLKEGNEGDEDRILNVRELVSMASQYDHLSGEEGIEQFLTNSALTTDQDDLEKPQDSVKLMTVHAAKGLEFDYVFISGMEDNLFPFKHLEEKEISQNEEEEERRLFYVAITRAKKKLFLSYAIVRNIFGTDRVSAPSEFLNDIDQNIIEEHRSDKPSGAKAIFIDF